MVKVSLGPMELFLLVAVRSGVSTVYELQQSASLSPGGIRPALEALERKGLLQRHEAGERGQRRMEITDAGIEAIQQSGDAPLNDAENSDLESVARVAWALTQIHPMNMAISFLRHAARSFHQRADERMRDAETAGAKRGTFAKYNWMRTLGQAHRLYAEADAIRRMADLLQQDKTHSATTKLSPSAD